MEDFIASNLGTYGPIAVFLLLMLSGIGISLGEDLITIPAGYFVGTGQFDLTQTLLAAYAGVVASDCLWFSICHHYGTPMLHRRWIKRLLHPRRLLEGKHQFEERGMWLIVMSRFIPGSRTTTITVAGMLQMPFWKFVAVTAACVMLTVPLQVGLGVLVARGIADMSFTEALPRIIGLVMVGVTAILLIRIYRRHRAKATRAPRAKARWLRRFRVTGWRRGRDAAVVMPIPGVPEPDKSEDHESAAEAGDQAR